MTIASHRPPLSSLLLARSLCRPPRPPWVKLASPLAARIVVVFGILAAPLVGHGFSRTRTLRLPTPLRATSPPRSLCRRSPAVPCSFASRRSPFSLPSYPPFLRDVWCFGPSTRRHPCESGPGSVRSMRAVRRKVCGARVTGDYISAAAVVVLRRRSAPSHVAARHTPLVSP